MEQQSRRAVIVLGMHRSGTSALAGTAIRLGASGPGHPLPPAGDNPGGFHEAEPVVLLNHLILSAAGRSWYDCLSFPPDMLDAEAIAVTLGPARRTLRDEFGTARFFVLKDPRLCLTLPVWLPALRAEGASVSILLAVRHPMEVARSLWHRDRMTEDTAAALWLHYVLEAERLSRGFPRAIVFYDDLLTAWRDRLGRAGDQAGIVWPAGIDAPHPEIDRYLSASTRHHAFSGPPEAGPPCVSHLIGAAWIAFRQLRDDPNAQGVMARLDIVRSLFASVRPHLPRPALATAGHDLRAQVSATARGPMRPAHQ